MAGAIEHIRLDCETVSLVFEIVVGGHADLLYFGPTLGADEDLASLGKTGCHGTHESQPDVSPIAGILPERKAGYVGNAAIALQRNGQRIATDFRFQHTEKSPQSIRFTFVDEREKLRADVTWSVRGGDVVKSCTRLINEGGSAVIVDRLASLALPIPRRFDRMVCFAGRWAGEMREYERDIEPHGFAHRSRAGKPGFDGGNWLILADAYSDAVIGAHLAWSGDHETLIDRDANGQAILLMGAGLDSGEICLAPGDAFESAKSAISFGADRSALAQSFHTHLRTDVLPQRRSWGPRKVHLNSWEALGFDMDEEKLMTLADSAAGLGVERFVLDDGWFGGRRDDQTSLGDWSISQDVLPNGLSPLIERVEKHGMDFGLWVEPEMVSPDSDLYRAHPDLCLHEDGRDRLTQRNQLVLDLTKPAVTEYLFECIDALLSAHRIAYLKWDHNRDLFPAANPERPVGHGQVEALYVLIDRLRDAHPHVEIESCASGGGRVDFAMLSRCHRIWASDNNDALERVRINRAWSQFLPLEVIGSHVGSSPNPVTGRRLNMDFRAKVALFGHMGIEADPAAMGEDERAILQAHITLYKQWRDVLHNGALFRLDHSDPGVSGLCVTHQAQAFALVCQTGFGRDFEAAPLRMRGLDARAYYRIVLLEPWPVKVSGYLTNPEDWHEGYVLSGRALMERGLALPLTHPETAWLIAMERID